MIVDVTRSVNRVLCGKRPTGIDRVCLAYLNRYSGVCRGLLWVAGRPCLLSICNTQWFNQALQDEVSRGWLILNLMGRLILDVLLNPRHGEVLLHLGHSGLEKPGLGKLVQKYKLRLICMVHDLIPITHPQFCRAGTPENHILRMKHLLTWSSGVLSNSQSTLNELTQFAEQHKLAIPASVVTHLPAASLLEASATTPVQAPYFVMLGTIEGRKNHKLILKVWQELIKKNAEKTPTLVIIGQRGWACDQVLQRLDNDAVLKSYIIELNDCDDATLSTWLSHAKALLFPSHVEGYGIPLVEALSLSTPAIASDLDVFYEIAGDVPEYLKPDDAANWLTAIEDYCFEGSQRRRAQMERLKGFKAPTWESHFMKAETLIK